MELARGANTAIADGKLHIGVEGSKPGTVDLLVLQLTEQRRVRTDNDLVFFNQPTSPEGAVTVSSSAVDIDLARVPADVATLAVAVSLDDSVPGSLAAIPSLGVTVSTGVRASAAGFTSERAALLVEIYRRGGAWKIRNVSQGWATGLAAVLREHGIDVADEPAADQPRTVPGEEKLSLEKKQKLDMRKKEVAKVLLTKQAAGVRARVVLVMDKTGSMYKQYRQKVVHRVIERMVPVAVQLDDDGTLEAYLYARQFFRLPDLRVADLETWPEQYIHLSGKHSGFDYDRIGAANDEIPIINAVLATATDPTVPTLVLFFTDGGFSKRREITQLMVQAASRPVFWQFVGIGKANYGLLEALDDMPGRVVDNAGFFALDDIDRVSDGELYQRLLNEFPDWLRAAKAAGILR
ncbi:VWA domain-containing protein [Fodinicola acaciae]|uniref:VWA domain-containing protein n=1 Tax=Fodinicola acaciae TaxID=2681555 RepID=UPI0013D1D30D|nr:VWA domain-containing protein [Fodinicola acaciae]